MSADPSWVASAPASALVAPPHRVAPSKQDLLGGSPLCLEHPVGAREALEADFPAFIEGEGAAWGDEVVQKARDKDLPALGLRTYARRNHPA